MRLIDADYALAALMLGEAQSGGLFETDSSCMQDFLKALPTIDAVPVVRCKDCKQFMEFRDSEKEKQCCDGTCYRLIMHCFDNDFAMVNATDCCSWGVKRDA